MIVLNFKLNRYHKFEIKIKKIEFKLKKYKNYEMHHHNLYSLKMEMAKIYHQNKNIKDYIKLEIENEKKINELIKNYKTKDPLLHKEYVKNIKKILLKNANNNNIVILKKNTDFFNKNKIVIHDYVHQGYSAVIYDTTE